MSSKRKRIAKPKNAHYKASDRINNKYLSEECKIILKLYKKNKGTKILYKSKEK